MGGKYQFVGREASEPLSGVIFFPGEVMEVLLQKSQFSLVTEGNSRCGSNGLGGGIDRYRAVHLRDCPRAGTTLL